MYNNSNRVTSDMFSRQGADYILKQNIYDNNGRLLLARGERISSVRKSRLESMGIFQKGNTDVQNIDAGIMLTIESQEPENILAPAIQLFSSRKNIKNKQAVTRSSQMLSSILFESKSKNWWVLVNAMLNYSEYLYTHSIDVAMISLILANELGYSVQQQWDLGLGAFLHDIGKILLPKSLVVKEDPLTDRERFNIQQHCELGQNSLKIFNLANECTDIVLHHHEHLDGSGYPKGLTGNEISKNTQIVMIANVLDNLSSSMSSIPTQTIDSAFVSLKNSDKKYPRDMVELLQKTLDT